MTTLLIAVESGGDVHVFANERDASSYLEPQDVANGEYEIYQENGTKVEASVVRQPGFAKPMKTVLTVTTEERPERLAQLLRSFLQQLPVQGVDGAGLPELVRLVRQRVP